MTAAPPPAAPPSPFKGLSRGFDAAVARGIGHVTRRTLGPHQSAVVRIGFAATMLLFLLREWPNRDTLYGPGSPWGLDLATRFVDSNQAFTVLLWSHSTVWFECVYHTTLLACVALLLGWRTRFSSIVFMVGVLSLQNRSVFMGDGGDNVIHLMAMYLTLTRCGRVWSLDARREARRQDGDGDDPVGVTLWVASGVGLLLSLTSGKLDSWIWAAFLCGMWAVHAVWWLLRRYAPGEPRVVADIIANLVHNAAIAVIMCEVCLIYAAAGWYKIQGSRWQDGTAVYYPMHLDYFTPWPWLSDLLSQNGWIILVMSYMTVFVQVGFVFALLNRRAKNILLFVMVGEHIGIAVLMGLPFFSLAMIAMDSVFLPTAFLLWGGSRVRAVAERLRLLPRPAPAGVPAPRDGAVQAPVPGPRPAVPDRASERW
ncbi:HTTM domain-containing protein [Streptomyces sp. RFCAC02]|uniref:HTTM domain-containing protein n=1 Tax=Streptomyces sp. RFCAC02 TaxID=2499143 RepID=UPI00143CD482|nr:HTTM domain-containing protein [Streptomyces sp. RFCAC02]